MYYSLKYQSPIGVYVIICDDENITGVWTKEQADLLGFETQDLTAVIGGELRDLQKWKNIEADSQDLTPEADSPHSTFATSASHSSLHSQTASPKSDIEPQKYLLQQAADWLDRYFRGEQPNITELPLKPEGTDFMLEVLEYLLKIPYGETISYGDIAKQIAEKRGIKRMSAQAVGGAVGRNPISVIIPCHRVIGSDGKMVGYTGGMDKKIWLLEHEKTAVK